MIETVLRLLAGVVLLAGNAFFVTTEFALTRIRQFDESEFSNHPGLRKAWEMTDELEIYLSGCQVGITVSSVLLGVVAEPAVTTVFSSLFHAVGITSSAGHSTVSILIALGVINLAHVIFGEQVPTYLGVERTKTVAKYLAPLLYIWVVVLGPVIRFADRISKGILGLFGVTITRSWKDDGHSDTEAEGGVYTIADTRRELGALLSGTPLSAERKTEVVNALEISGTPVQDIMIPADDIRALPETDSLDEVLAYIQERPHTRYPLIGSGGEAFVGTVYTATVLQHLSELRSGETALEDIAADLMVVGPDTSVSELIDQFQQEQQELAIVTKTGDVPVARTDALGLVTTTDAFEEIAGDLEDPIDSEEGQSAEANRS